MDRLTMPVALAAALLLAACGREVDNAAAVAARNAPPQAAQADDTRTMGAAPAPRDARGQQTQSK
jgi:hypothetical protein